MMYQRSCSCLVLVFVLCGLSWSPIQSETINIGIISDSNELYRTLSNSVNKSADEANVTKFQLLDLPVLDGVNPPGKYLRQISAQLPEPCLLLVSVEGCQAKIESGAWVSSVQIPRLLLPPPSCSGPCMSHTCVSFIRENSTDAGETNQLSIKVPIEGSNAARVFDFIMLNKEWTAAVIFYSPSEAYELIVDDFVFRLSQRRIPCIVHRVTTVKEISEAVQSSYSEPEYPMPYFVLADEESILEILNQALEFELRRYEYSWIIYSLDARVPTLTTALVNQENILLLQPSAGDFLQEAAGYYTQAVLQAVGRNYVSFGGGSDYTDMLSIIAETVASPPMSYYSYPQWDLHSVIEVSGGAPEFKQVGTWWSDARLGTDMDLFPNRFGGFNNNTFVIVSLEYAFFQKKEVQPDGSIKWTGLTFELLDELARDLNFSYIVVEPPDGAYGISDENGTWNGMIGMVIRKEVDFAASVFSITAARQQVIDFCSPIYLDDSAVIMRKPTDDNRLLLYLQPFQLEVWLMIVACTFVTGILLWVFSRFSPFYKHASPWSTVGQSTIDGLALLKHAILYIYGAVVQQGGFYLPNAQSGRVLVGCFWFFAIVVVATYTGNLIAFLAVQQVQLPFNSLSEMVGQSSMQWGTASGVALVMLFRDAKVQPYVSVHEGNQMVESYSEGLRRVKEEQYAFIAEKSWYNSAAAADTECELAMMKEVFYPTNYAMAFLKGVPYLKLFNEKITKMTETGLLEHWVQKWTPQNLNCTGLKAVTMSRVVTLSDFQGALYVLMFGGGSAILILVGEQIFNFCRQRRKRKWAKHDVETAIFNIAEGLKPNVIQAWS